MVLNIWFNEIFINITQITGGANGIGLAIGVELAGCGCNIAVADIDIDSAREAVEEFNLLGVKARAYEVKMIKFKKEKRN